MVYKTFAHVLDQSVGPLSHHKCLRTWALTFGSCVRYQPVRQPIIKDMKMFKEKSTVSKIDMKFENSDQIQ